MMPGAKVANGNAERRGSDAGYGHKSTSKRGVSQLWQDEIDVTQVEASDNLIYTRPNQLTFDPPGLNPDMELNHKMEVISALTVSIPARLWPEFKLPASDYQSATSSFMYIAKPLDNSITPYGTAPVWLCFRHDRRSHGTTGLGFRLFIHFLHFVIFITVGSVRIFTGRAVRVLILHHSRRHTSVETEHVPVLWLRKLIRIGGVRIWTIHTKIRHTERTTIVEHLHMSGRGDDVVLRDVTVTSSHRRRRLSMFRLGFVDHAVTITSKLLLLGHRTFLLLLYRLSAVVLKVLSSSITQPITLSARLTTIVIFNDVGEHLLIVSGFRLFRVQIDTVPKVLLRFGLMLQKLGEKRYHLGLVRNGFFSSSFAIVRQPTQQLMELSIHDSANSWQKFTCFAAGVP
uniref:Uncharacterized protein n=1 Tax=Anopheles farauti TaxID=69004 RepID=A0A182Q7A9_9DIPT